jgi:transposase
MPKYRRYSEAERIEAVELARISDRTMTEVAQDLSLNPATLWRWVMADKKSEEKKRTKKRGELSSQEREELERLRKENLRLRQERDLLKKSVAFFVKESS